MYHYTYRTTNTINGKIYVGKHSTSNLDDGYIGSGKALNRAFVKHGKNNFTREILEFFGSSEEAFAAEAKIVNDEFVLREDTYNMKPGGFGAPKGHQYTANLKFYNNGTICKRYVEGTQPDGWSTGRLKCEFNKNRGELSDEHKEKLSSVRRGLTPTINTRKVECPHCGKVGQEANMKRWHFDKCKHRIDRNG